MSGTAFVWNAKAAFSDARERAQWCCKNEIREKYPRLTRFGAPAVPTP
jgi:hypothetical protein